MKKNLRDWIEYFKNLSDRIRVIVPSEKKSFPEFLENVKAQVREILDLQDDEILLGWPKPEDVAFIVAINSAHPNQGGKFLVENVRIFCFGDFAFGFLYYFSWDGDAEEDPNCKTYSVKKIRSATCWQYIAKRIKNDITEMNQEVPALPQ